MATDIKDLTRRLEKEFAVNLHPEWGGPRLLPAGQPDLTAAEVHQRVVEVLKSAGREVPFSSWHRVKRCVARSLRVPVKQVKPESLLRKDLGAK